MRASGRCLRHRGATWPLSEDKDSLQGFVRLGTRQVNTPSPSITCQSVPLNELEGRRQGKFLTCDALGQYPEKQRVDKRRNRTENSQHNYPAQSLQITLCLLCALQNTWSVPRAAASCHLSHLICCHCGLTPVTSFFNHLLPFPPFPTP